MRVVLFYHSLVSDWNHGNAHFLRGVCRELVARGHRVEVWEPEDGWSRRNLIEERGPMALRAFARSFPDLSSRCYDLETFDLDAALEGADLVLVHEWNDHRLVRRIGEHRRRVGGYHLLFHDTHHRSVTDPASMEAYDLSWYDGVLAFGDVVRQIYLDEGWTPRAWTWHEAADVSVFRPLRRPPEGDVVWVGNWGDEERTAELRSFLLEPVEALGLAGAVHGVRYPEEGRAALARAGLEYRSWIANSDVPEVFARFRFTVHVPRRPYVEALPGIPTIRVFEALAAGIPLLSAPWRDVEGLFRADHDFLMARDGEEMRELMRLLIADPAFGHRLARHGRETILARHTCAHRVDELLAIVRELDGESAATGRAAVVTPGVPAEAAR